MGPDRFASDKKLSADSDQQSAKPLIKLTADN
jgi:hypothetical protein